MPPDHLSAAYAVVGDWHAELVLDTDISTYCPRLALGYEGGVTLVVNPAGKSGAPAAGVVTGEVGAGSKAGDGEVKFSRDKKLG